MSSILKYTINIFLLLLVCSQVEAQKDTTNVASKTKIINSIGVELDVSPVVTTFINKNAAYSFEGAVNAEILKKYFAVVELGYADADKTALNGIHFNTSGFFGRAGFDFSLLKDQPGTKKTIKSYLTGGVRIGMSSATYMTENVVITDDYWNTTENYTFHQPSTNFWYEIVGGIRVEIMKNIFMGWSIRNRNLLTDIETGQPYPWYIPGFGIANSTANWGFNYSLGVRF